MSGLSELNKILKNSKFIPKKKEEEAEIGFIKDLLNGFKGVRNEKTNNKK